LIRYGLWQGGNQRRWKWHIKILVSEGRSHFLASLDKKLNHFGWYLTNDKKGGLTLAGRY